MSISFTKVDLTHMSSDDVLKILIGIRSSITVSVFEAVSSRIKVWCGTRLVYVLSQNQVEPLVTMGLVDKNFRVTETGEKYLLTFERDFRAHA